MRASLSVFQQDLKALPSANKGDAGANGATGDEGPEGKEGSPWTVGGVLPPEETETGAWAINTTASDTAGGFEGISFTLPLPEALEASEVHFVGAANANCPGTLADPKALPGHLCVYGSLNGATAGLLGFIVDPATFGPGAAKSGAVLNASGTGFGMGTWAVTAPEEP